MTAPVFSTFIVSRRLVLTTNSSEVASLEVLTQPGNSDVRHLVVYKSSKLTRVEQAYQTHVLELLAVVHTFNECFLSLGTGESSLCRLVGLRTDNNAVT